MVSGINVAIEYLFGINVFQEMVPQEIAKGIFPIAFLVRFVDTWIIHVCVRLWFVMQPGQFTLALQER